MTYYPIIIYSIFACSLLSLGGCNPFILARDDSTQIQSKGIAKRGEDSDISQPPLYCYDTLGDKMCYPQPLEKEKTRLRSYYGPTPQNYLDDIAAE